MKKLIFTLFLCISTIPLSSCYEKTTCCPVCNDGGTDDADNTNNQNNSDTFDATDISDATP